jgi:two-component system LytT family response regulator
MNLNAIIIDDEKMAQNLLYAMLKDNCPNIKVLELCNDLSTGITAINKHKPDVVFLDIEMPEHSGLEILTFFKEEELFFDIVFVTAYSEFAVDAFKLSAADYLLKPINSENLIKAINRLQKRKEKTGGQTQVLSALKTNLESQSIKKIAITVGQGVKLIDLCELVYMKADRSYTEVVLKNDQLFIVSKNLGQFEEALEPCSNFIRINKSYIINLDFITEINKSDGGFIMLDNKHEIAISLEKRDAIMKLIEQKIYKV